MAAQPWLDSPESSALSWTHLIGQDFLNSYYLSELCMIGGIGRQALEVHQIVPILHQHFANTLQDFAE